MYKLTIELKEVGEYKTFSEAFRELYERVKKMLKDGMALFTLEQTIFIETEIDGIKCPLGFYDARDLACEIGLLENGKLQEIPLGHLEENLIETTFLASKMGAMAEVSRINTEIERMKEEMAKTGQEN